MTKLQPHYDQPEAAVLLSSGNPTEKWNVQAIFQAIKKQSSNQDHTNHTTTATASGSHAQK